MHGCADCPMGDPDGLTAFLVWGVNARVRHMRDPDGRLRFLHRCAVRRIIQVGSYGRLVVDDGRHRLQTKIDPVVVGFHAMESTSAVKSNNGVIT